MRELLKIGACRTLTGLGVPALARRIHRDSAVILAYHNIVPDGEASDGERSLHLRQAEFGRQLDLLSETHEIVPLEELFDTRGSDRPRAAITFDDGYSGALDAGLQELTVRGIPATYFISPGLLDRTTFWWDALAATHAGTLPSSIRRAALSDWSGRQERILGWAEREGIGRGTVPNCCRSARLGELRNAASQPGVTIGSHTWSHPNLNAIGPAAVRQELERCRRWLDREMKSVIPWLAYPYGLSPDELSNRGLRQGERALTTDPQLIGLDRSNLDLLRIPRINISAGLGLARFELLTAGV